MINDPIAEYVNQGQIFDASTLPPSTPSKQRVFEADVAIIGSGAGGGITAEILSASGLKVIILEEGPLKTSKNFKMLEREAYPQLYQESLARQTKDKGITILQGRSVGGSTTVNWGTCFRTPASTLLHWQTKFGLSELTEGEMAPWFSLAENRLNITEWAGEPNPNNSVLQKGAEIAGLSWGKIHRNVKGCWNLGYCGVGCPVGAKQSMLVTTLPSALKMGASLVHHVRVEKLEFQGDKVTAAHCVALDENCIKPVGSTNTNKILVKARHFVLSAGAIGSPALLMRSGAADPYRIVGSRTFLHPVAISVAEMPEMIDAASGAPQSIYSDHFNEGTADEIGFKLEVPPLHPVLSATTLLGIGVEHSSWMERYRRLHVQMALMRDGFHDLSPGGQVRLRSDGSPLLDYTLTDFVWAGLKRSLLKMAELQFAAGAKEVLPIHEQGRGYKSWSEAKAAILQLSTEVMRFRVYSAHVMGGCRMGATDRDSVVSVDGRHHGLANLSIIDGSVFPTSVGANPQLSIYGLAWRNATKLAASLKV